MMKQVALVLRDRSHLEQIFVVIVIVFFKKKTL